MLSKEQLIDAHDQGLNVQTKGGTTFKIVAHLMDVFAIKSNENIIIKWWHLDKFIEEECTIEQPKPTYNGRAVKCDTVEQLQWLNSELKEKSFNTQFLMSNHCICISDKNSHFIGKIQNEEHFKHEGYEIISFSQYCEEKGITEPRWIQGFEVKDGYNDVVICSNDANYRTYSFDVLKTVYNHCNNTFCCIGNTWKYCRYPRKDEINEIKFSN